MSDLQPIGVVAVVENLDGFMKAIAQVNKGVDQAAAGIQKSTASTSKWSQALGSAASVIKGGVGVALGVVATGAVAAATAIGGLATAMVALAIRGDTFVGLAQGFSHVTQSLGLQKDMLDQLHVAAQGTMTDMDLMARANLAMTGTYGQLAKEFSAAIPRLLEIARNQALVTGQSVDYLFDSLLLGIKRSSPRLLDNTGLIIRLGAAEEKYAKELGKSTQELTAQEYQIAILRATMTAGNITLQQFGKIHETAAIKSERLTASLGNAANTISLALQPAFEKILDTIQPLVNWLGKFATAAAPYVAAIANMAANLLKGILGPITKGLEKLTAPEAAKAFFTGGARLMGSLAGGIAAGAHEVLQVVAVVAKAIASFLVGKSPPPEGPLSQITLGGENTMKAWIEGFMGVSLDPVKEVAAEIMNAMGPIASYGLEYTKGLIIGLDAELKPFQDRVDILTNQFEALKPVTDAAFTAIDRQMEKALKALNQGIAGSDDQIRALDKQKEALQAYVDTQQSQIDTANVQLALAKAAQEPERTLLNIRKDMFQEIPLAPGAGEGDKLKTENAKKTKAEDVLGFDPEPVFNAITEEADNFSAKVALATSQMKNAFQEGFTSAGGNVKALQADIKAINDAAGTISKSWDNLPQSFDKLWVRVRESVETEWTRIRTGIEKSWNDIWTNAGNWWRGVIVPGLEQFWKALGDFVDIKWTEIRTSVETAWSEIWTNAGNWWNGVIVPGLEGIWKALGDFVNIKWTEFKTPIEKTWNDVWTSADLWWNKIIVPGLQGIWESMKSYAKIKWEELKTTISGIWTEISNWISSRASELGATVSRILQPIADLIQRIRDFLTGGPPTSSSAGIIGEMFRQRAGGGPFGAGDNLLVGERGPELVSFGRSGFVFPNNVTSMLANAANIYARPAMATAGTYNTYVYNQQQSIGDFNFHGMRDSGEALRRFTQMRAMRRWR